MLDMNDIGKQVAGAQTKKRVRLDMRNKISTPQHSHHVGRIAGDNEDPETSENQAVLVSDGIKTFEWLAADSTRCLIGQEWVDFCRENGWTRGHRHAVAELVRTELVHRCNESAEESRARITIHAQNLYRDARLSGDYSPAVSALKLQADMLLPKTDEVQKHVHVHTFVARIPKEADSIEAWAEESSKALPPPATNQ